MELNKLNNLLEAEWGPTSASLIDFMEAIEEALKNKKPITVEISSAHHDVLPSKPGNLQTAGFTKDAITWKIEDK